MTSDQTVPRFALLPSASNRPAPAPGTMVFREYLGTDVGAFASTGLVLFHDYATEDVVLIMPRERAQEVREVVAQLHTSGRGHHL